MVSQANEWFRKEMSQYKQLKYWMVAHEIGIDRSTLSHWLRFELSGEKKEKVHQAIYSLLHEMKQDSKLIK